MLPDTARRIGEFLEANKITSINVMGGEFFCNQDWLHVLIYLGHGRKMRLVTNGDWYPNQKVKNDLLELASRTPGLNVAISYDKWHINKYTFHAKNYLDNEGIYYTTAEWNGSEGVVPIGRAKFEYGEYSTFSCYCEEPRRKYSIMIDEEGNIAKCVFGLYNFSHINDHIGGGFDHVFKKFGTQFYKVFRGNCVACQRMHKQFLGMQTSAAELVLKEA